MCRVMKILAVEDEKFALDHILGILKRLEPESEIIGVRSGTKALEEAKSEVPFDVAFLDIDLRDINGIELARRLKMRLPKLNVIFTTGYGDYAGDAFDLHASGYIMKPLTDEKVRRELDDLRHPLHATSAVSEEKTGESRLKVRAFGNFEVFDQQGIPLVFQYAKTKEMFAYLIDRKGAFCTNGEIMGILWGDEASSSKQSYLKNLRTDLGSALKSAGYENVLIRRRGMIAVVPDQIDCDYYDWLKGIPSAINSYRGEYMVQYSWSEFTNSQLEKSGS